MTHHDNTQFKSGATQELKRLEQGYGWSIEPHAAFSDGVWKVKSKQTLQVDFPSEGYERCLEMEQQSFWFRHRNLILGKLWQRYKIAPGFWEVGSGNGFVAAHIAALGGEVVTVEPGLPGAIHSAKRGLLSLNGLIEQLLLPNDSLDAIGCFDVIEHIPEPHNIIAEFSRVIRRGGRLFITVPALEWLWSQTDEMSGHHRRYKKTTLIDEISPHGFKTLYSSYYFMSLVPIAYCLRALPHRLGKVFSSEQLTRDQNAQMDGVGGGVAGKALDLILDFERSLALSSGLPLGTSLIAVFEKV